MLGQPQSISASAEYKNLKKMERSIVRGPFKSLRLGPMSSKRQLTVPDAPSRYLYVHTALFTTSSGDLGSGAERRSKQEATGPP